MPRNNAYLPPDSDSATLDVARREFADRLRVRMNQKGWTQSEFARKAGVKRDAISTYINGKRWPDPVNLKKIAKALVCPPDELIPSISSAAPPSAVAMTQDGDGMHLRINKRVSLGQAARILAILEEDQSRALLPA